MKTDKMILINTLKRIQRVSKLNSKEFCLKNNIPIYQYYRFMLGNISLTQCLKMVLFIIFQSNLSENDKSILVEITLKVFSVENSLNSVYRKKRVTQNKVFT